MTQTCNIKLILFLTFHEALSEKKCKKSLIEFQCQGCDKRFSFYIESSQKSSSIESSKKNQSGMGVMDRLTRPAYVYDSIDIFDSYTAPSDTRPTSSHHGVLLKGGLKKVLQQSPSDAQNFFRHLP